MAPAAFEQAPGEAAARTTTLPFDERAVFIAGPARSGTTLLTALLDGHPDLLVFPEETAYFPTILTKYGTRSRQEQFEYLTTATLANVVFGGQCKWGKRDYGHFPTGRLRERFKRGAFAPGNRQRDLLALLMEALAEVDGRPQESVRGWVEKTPANRDHFDAIFRRFPHAKILLTLRDPRALLASQILLERTRRLRRFSAYLVARHWLTAARLALKQQAFPQAEYPVEVVEYSRLLAEPEKTMRRVCAFLDVEYHSATLVPTKAGRVWQGNSASESGFEAINSEPDERWRKLLTDDEIGWIEWHCRPQMELLGYEPLFSRRRLRHWATPLTGETPREYLKSRFYSIFGKPVPRQN